MSSRFCLRAVMVAAGLMSAHSVLAQTGDTRAYQAVFGGASHEPNLKQNFGISLAAQEAIGEDGSRTSGQGIPIPELGLGPYTAFGADGRYDWRGKATTFGLTAGTTARYYARGGRFVTESHQVGANLSTGIGKGFNLFASQAFAYTPTYFYGLQSGDTDASGLPSSTTPSNLLGDNSRSLVNSSNLTLSRNLTRRGVATFTSSLRLINATGALGVRDQSLTAYDIGGVFNYGLARDIGLVLGYTYKTAEYADGTRPVEHNIDAGVDYHKALSISRRTKFTSTLGSAVLSGPAGATTLGVPNAFSHQFQLRGTAELTHQVGRTWQLRGIYRREIGYVQELRTPTLTNGWSASLNGLVNRRIDVSSEAAYAQGNSAFTGAAGFTTYTGTAKARMALGHKLAATVEYQYYFHQFAQTADLSAGVPQRLSSNALRVGVSYWIPVMRRK